MNGIWPPTFSRKPPAKSTGETHRCIWLAANRVGRSTQQWMSGLEDQIILLGQGEISDIGPGAAHDARTRLEFRLPIRFQHGFSHPPHVVVLPALRAVEPTAHRIQMEARNITPDTFSLILHPALGSPRCVVGFHWVAIGSSRAHTMDDHESAATGSGAPPPSIVPTDPQCQALDMPMARARALWLASHAAYAELLQIPPLRQLRGARHRLLNLEVPTC